MELFWFLLLKLIPLYTTIVMGFVAGRFLKIETESVAKLVFFMIAPLVVFNGVARLPITLPLLGLPILVFVLSSIMSLIFYRVGGWAFKDSSRNLLSMAAGTGNTGYFGLPLAMMLFDERGVGIYIIAFTGMNLFEVTVGYYIASLGASEEKPSLMEAGKKILKLPMFYGVLLGIAFSFSGLKIPPIMDDFMAACKGSYSILGMMIIGLGLAKMQKLSFDWRFVGLAHSAKFIIWPALAYITVLLDRELLHIFDEAAHKSLLLISIVPMAANTVLIATLLRLKPEKAATTVVTGTIIALIYVPLMAALLIK
ncbi:MAG: AEC family transporter [Alphaproteobacteria bacterium]